MRWAIALIVTTGCYKPSVVDCQYSCSADQRCPDGTECGANGMCAAPGVSCPGDGPGSDLDAPPIVDGPAGCESPTATHLWCPEASDTTQLLDGVYIASDEEVWAVGDNAAITRKRAGSWHKEMSSISLRRFLAIDGLGPTAIWAVGAGGVITVWDGSAWTTAPTVPNAGGTDFTAIGTDGVSEVWIAGTNGTVLHATKGSSVITPMTTVAGMPSLFGITLQSTTLLAAGQAKGIYTHTLANNTDMWSGTGNGTGPYLDAFGVKASPGAYLAAADGIFLSAGGNVTSESAKACTAIAGTSMVDVFAACAEGVFKRGSGTTWDLVMDSPRNMKAIAVSNKDIYVVGLGGAIYHYKR